jgi:hypothetical protein
MSDDAGDEHILAKAANKFQWPPILFDPQRIWSCIELNTYIPIKFRATGLEAVHSWCANSYRYFYCPSLILRWLGRTDTDIDFENSISPEVLLLLADSSASEYSRPQTYKVLCCWEDESEYFATFKAAPYFTIWYFLIHLFNSGDRLIYHDNIEVPETGRENWLRWYQSGQFGQVMGESSILGHAMSSWIPEGNEHRGRILRLHSGGLAWHIPVMFRRNTLLNSAHRTTYNSRCSC